MRHLALMLVVLTSSCAPDLEGLDGAIADGLGDSLCNSYGVVCATSARPFVTEEIGLLMVGDSINVIYDVYRTPTELNIFSSDSAVFTLVSSPNKLFITATGEGVAWIRAIDRSINSDLGSVQVTVVAGDAGLE
jgi:hypothetical protein